MFRRGWNEETSGATPPRIPQHSTGASRRQCATIASWMGVGMSRGGRFAIIDGRPVPREGAGGAWHGGAVGRSSLSFGEGRGGQIPFAEVGQDDDDQLAGVLGASS